MIFSVKYIGKYNGKVLKYWYYYIFYYYNKENSEPIELFEIGLSPKNLVEDTKSNPKVEGILAENDNNYYQLIVKDKKSFEKYDLTLDNMKEYFSIIYK